MQTQILYQNEFALGTKFWLWAVNLWVLYLRGGLPALLKISLGPSVALRLVLERRPLWLPHYVTFICLFSFYCVQQKISLHKTTSRTQYKNVCFRTRPIISIIILRVEADLVALLVLLLLFIEYVGYITRYSAVSFSFLLSNKLLMKVKPYQLFNMVTFYFIWLDQLRFKSLFVQLQPVFDREKSRAASSVGTAPLETAVFAMNFNFIHLLLFSVCWLQVQIPGHSFRLFFILKNFLVKKLH